MADPIRILFVGELHSSHAQSWIQLLEHASGRFSIAGVQTSDGPLVAPFPVYTSLQGRSVPKRALRYFSRLLYGAWVEKIQPFYAYGDPAIQVRSLVTALKRFRPHIVHTFGFTPGALLYMSIPEKLRAGIRWVHQFRGGPDLAHNIHKPTLRPLLEYTVTRCVRCICDNELNVTLTRELGIEPAKLMSRIYPGTGGVDVPLGSIAPLAERPPVIVWPKAYTCVQSDGYPVLEALRQVMQTLPEVRLVALAASEDISFWAGQILSAYVDRIEVHTRIPREASVRLLLSSRVMLAPSLSEGIPNSLYEAMAAGCVPVVSPLPTITPHFIEGENVFYARNLYPEEIAAAVFRAFDNSACQGMQTRNLEKVWTMADRSVIAERIIGLYEELGA